MLYSIIILPARLKKVIKKNDKFSVKGDLPMKAFLMKWTTIFEKRRGISQEQFKARNL